MFISLKSECDSLRKIHDNWAIVIYHSSVETVMRQQFTDAEKQRMEDRLFELRQEHRDLDDVINRLLLSAVVEEMQLKRFKKRKLLLKDAILKLENALIPDILA